MTPDQARIFQLCNMHNCRIQNFAQLEDLYRYTHHYIRVYSPYLDTVGVHHTSAQLLFLSCSAQAESPLESLGPAYSTPASYWSDQPQPHLIIQHPDNPRHPAGRIPCVSFLL